MLDKMKPYKSIYKESVDYKAIDSVLIEGYKKARNKTEYVVGIVFALEESIELMWNGLKTSGVKNYPDFFKIAMNESKDFTIDSETGDTPDPNVSKAFGYYNVPYEFTSSDANYIQSVVKPLDSRIPNLDSVLYLWNEPTKLTQMITKQTKQLEDEQVS